jgi:glutathione S-transferase
MKRTVLLSMIMLLSIMMLMIMTLMTFSITHGFSGLATTCGLSRRTTPPFQQQQQQQQQLGGGGGGAGRALLFPTIAGAAAAFSVAERRRQRIAPLVVVQLALNTASSLSTTEAPTNNDYTTTTLLDDGTSSSLSWDGLAAKLKAIANQKEQEEEDPSSPPLLTLYRDTNGWCPFCERVWLCLEVKGIPYRERLVNLQNKPDWYKELVPTSLVPAVLLHNDEIIENKNRLHKNDDRDSSNNTNQKKSSSSSSSSSSQRQIVWESLEILQVLDEAFPETKRLVWKDLPAYNAALEQVSSLASAGFKYTYNGSRNNQTLNDFERQQLKQNLLDELDRLDAVLAKSEGGPFLLGANFTAVDACLIPTLERWRYQLAPPLNDIILDKGRPHGCHARLCQSRGR